MFWHGCMYVTSLPFSVEWLILDEADKLFEDGKLGFRDQVRGVSCVVLKPSTGGTPESLRE